jgi:2-polyprenyl-3-methyl-5-hydroxy-6-metoxy-1,4-benzoquinol methylase
VKYESLYRASPALHCIALPFILDTSYSLLQTIEYERDRRFATGGGCLDHKRLLRVIAYGLPVVGGLIRSAYEKIRAERDYGSQEYWDFSLRGWAKSYVAGTIQIDIRNGITGILVRHFLPQAKSVLDIGCAGGTLSSCIDGCQRYHGVDISQVAITEALALKTKWKDGPVATFSVADLRSFHSDETFDVIVFNEVLYYLTLESIETEIFRYCQFLSPGGVVIVSLKNDEISRIIHRLLCQRLERIFSTIFQNQPKVPSWKITYTREHPAMLLSVFRPVRDALQK